MASLYEILNNSHDGEGIAALAREFGLTPTQTQAAVTALLPAVSTGLKQSTATPDGLGNLFSVMGQQQDLQDMYDDSEAAFGSDGVAAGNDTLSAIFGSPDVSRAVIDQAQKFSGVSSNILQKMFLVVLNGQCIVAAAVDDLLGNGSLATHSINGHQGTLQVQHVEQSRNGSDFIRLAGCLGDH